MRFANPNAANTFAAAQMREIQTLQPGETPPAIAVGEVDPNNAPPKADCGCGCGGAGGCGGHDHDADDGVKGWITSTFCQDGVKVGSLGTIPTLAVWAVAVFVIGFIAVKLFK